MGRWFTIDLAWSVGAALALVQRECPVVAVIAGGKSNQENEHAEEAEKDRREG
jgi:hypothetical protein